MFKTFLENLATNHLGSISDVQTVGHNKQKRGAVAEISHMYIVKMQQMLCYEWHHSVEL